MNGRPKFLHVGGTIYWVLRTYDPDTMVLKDADSTPTVAVRKNGASTGDSVTVTKRSATTGIYDCSYNPAGEVEGDEFTIEETATVTGTTTGSATYSSSWEFSVIAVERGTDSAALASGVNVTQWGGTAVASATVRSDIINVAGAAVSTSTAQLGVNVVNAGGTAWGSGAITSGSIAAGAITAIAAGVWNALTSGLTTVGSIGKHIVDRIVGTLASGTHNPQSGDAFSRLGSPSGASISADVATKPTLAQMEASTVIAKESTLSNIQNRIPAALVGGRMDSSVGAYQSGMAPLQPAVDGRTIYLNVGGQVSSETDLDVAEIRGAIGLGAADLDVQLAAIKTDSAAIKLKTDNLPADPADASDIAAAFGTVNGTLATMSAYIDTEIAAIKVATDRYLTMIVLDGAVYKFTPNALEDAPAGGGGSGAVNITVEDQSITLG